ncbi:MAG: aldose 1-epimerase family protein [Segetibacter sp.]
MHSISNNTISIEVADKGAELQSIYHNQHELEYMWSGDPSYWSKKSPVLFPIVGTLKNNTYNYKGKDYKLSRHGFARDNDFELVEKTNFSLTFSLKSNELIKTFYPFDFVFSVKYSLQENKLQVTFTVENTGLENLLFSVGGHPAFAVPLVKETKYEDYYLEFSQNEYASRWPLSSEGLIETTPIPLLNDKNRLPLKKELFYKDALVFKHLKSNSISIVSDKTPHGLQVQFTGFPYMGIWAAKDADFVCIEPWCGIADDVNASGNLEDKEGINTLVPEGRFQVFYSIEVF